MACRKDGKGRVLRKGEGYRKGDGRYSYVYIDPLGKKRTIYAQSLVKLREREEQLQKDQLDGLDVYVAGKADVNFLFDRYISTKTELRSTTYSNYLYTWNHFIRDTFGKKKVRDVKYSDVLFFYTDLINNQGLQINTLETINTVLKGKIFVFVDECHRTQSGKLHAAMQAIMPEARRIMRGCRSSERRFAVSSLFLRRFRHERRHG